MKNCSQDLCRVDWKPGKAMPKTITNSLPYLLAYGLDIQGLTVKQLASECTIPIATMYRCLRGVTPFSLKNAMSMFNRLYGPGSESSILEFFNELLDHPMKGLT